jgi:signal transduction histidine kinase
MHDKIFELYFTTKKDGSGIGLAQTYQVLQWHYGSVDFESVEGAGTIFRFHIPAVGAAMETRPEYSADAAAAQAQAQRGD